MGKKIVVADTNTIVSAFGWKGKPRKIIGLAAAGKIALYISPQTFDEFCRVIEYQKFGFSAEKKEKLRSFLLRICERTQPTRKLEIVKDDPKDNIIIECADSCGADYIVTGDKHLLKIGKLGRAKIITAAKMLGEMA